MENKELSGNKEYSWNKISSIHGFVTQIKENHSVDRVVDIFIDALYYYYMQNLFRLLNLSVESAMYYHFGHSHPSRYNLMRQGRV